MPDPAIFDLTGQTALVTGGTTGIGLGMARGLARAGAAVAICGRDAAKGEAAAEELRTLNEHCRFFAVDLDDIESLPGFYRHVAEGMHWDEEALPWPDARTEAAPKSLGGIGILVNNAGINILGSAENIALADFERVQRVNVTAPFVLSQCFARERIAARRPGSIVFTASLMSEAARPTTAPYTASKGGVRQLVRALAVDWAPHGIRVNGIGPGYIETEMTRPLREQPEFDAWVRRRTPLGRWGCPDDFEGAVVFLASDAARFVTGQILYVDGGWLATF